MAHNIINFQLQDVETHDTIKFTGELYQTKIHTRRGISKWCYIPWGIIRKLNLQLGQPVYFYVVDQTTLMLSFRDPNLKKARKRHTCYAGNSTKNLTITLPALLLREDILQAATQIQFLNPVGETAYEWQLRLL